MQKQDYIEKIAAYIVEDWNAADAGDQAASKAAKQSGQAKRHAYRKEGRRGARSNCRLLAHRGAIPSGRPVLGLIAGEAPQYRLGGVSSRRHPQSNVN